MLCLQQFAHNVVWSEYRKLYECDVKASINHTACRHVTNSDDIRRADQHAIYSLNIMTTKYSQNEKYIFSSNDRDRFLTLTISFRFRRYFEDEIL